MMVLDLKSNDIAPYTSRPLSEDAKDELWPDGVCADHGLFAEKAVRKPACVATMESTR